jgi:hypothetical protein
MGLVYGENKAPRSRSRVDTASLQSQQDGKSSLTRDEIQSFKDALSNGSLPAETALISLSGLSNTDRQKNSASNKGNPSNGTIHWQGIPKEKAVSEATVCSVFCVNIRILLSIGVQFS